MYRISLMIKMQRLTLSQMQHQTGTKHQSMMHLHARGNQRNQLSWEPKTISNSPKDHQILPLFQIEETSMHQIPMSRIKQLVLKKPSQITRKAINHLHGMSHPFNLKEEVEPN